MSPSVRAEVTEVLRRSDNRDRTFEDALQNLKHISINEGLTEGEIQKLVGVITSNKLASGVTTKLLQCMVPSTSISHSTLKNLLLWYFSVVESGKISKLLEKQFINWIIGIVQYELGDIDLIDSYFHSFLFLLRIPHLEAVVSKLLCLIVKPEDARRCTVKKVLEIQRQSGPKIHINSLLSILKSFRPDMVPEHIPMTRINYENTMFHEIFQKAHERKIQNDKSTPELQGISWNQNITYGKQTARLTRLIPTAANISFEPSTKLQKRTCSVMDIKDMNSLGVHWARIEIPAQTLSLLANVAGFHVLAFSDSVSQSRFCNKLYHTLFRVFILELDPYSPAEKSAFLDSIIGLQEYMQEGIPVVTEFLFHYLLIWDGDEFRQQIFSLIQWIDIKSQKDYQECFFRPLRQIFRSSGLHCKYLIIEAMGGLLRNVIAFNGKTESLFPRDATNYNSVKRIEDVVSFASELIVEGLIWNNGTGCRDIATAGLNFYEICSILEYSEEFPCVLVMPPALVYGCLFSGSRTHIARLCSVLMRFWKNTMEKLSFFGNADGYKLEVEQANIFILDCYRCLWNSTDFLSSKESFLFHHKGFSELLWSFQKCLNLEISNIFNLDNSFIFWNGGDNFNQDFIRILKQDYPSIINFKNFCEELMS